MPGKGTTGSIGMQVSNTRTITAGQPTDRGCRPLRADAARNRERILAAAAEVFAERGLEATLDDIADRAGVGVGTVYRRFANKEALVEALFVQAVNQVIDLAEAAAAIEDSWKALVWFLEQATQLWTEDLGLRDVMLHSDYGREQVAQAKERIVALVAQLVERAQHEGSLRTDLVTADLPLIELMLSSVVTYTSRISPDLWRRYLIIVLDGLCAQRSGWSTLPDEPSDEAVEFAMRSRHGGC
jgi:AcrR family transcriptional regulator